MKVPVSILMPIRNEAANLPRCLAAVAWADEIFVVDSNSTDGSQAIVEAFARKAEIEKVEGGNKASDCRAREEKTKARHLTPIKAEREGQHIHLVQFAFNGTWPKKKNWALENLPFKHEWVFILDADEVMPPEAEAEFRAIVSSIGNPQSETGNKVAGYWINRRFMFMGKWLKHAYYPNWNLRLFKHRLGRYEKLTDVATASGDNEVHEHVVVNGQTAHLKCEMDHYAFPSVDVFVEKHNRYSNWEARVALDRALKGSSQSLQSRQVGWLRRLKQLSQRLPFRPFLRFLYVYLWQRGFLDGVEGWHFARLHAMYEYLCVVKMVELKQRKKAEH